MLTGKSQKELLKLARQIVQPLQPNFHKGQAGKVGVFGGCEDYTGAPFFASHSAALVGADLSHVVCEKLAGPIIKGYSPDLMVHPYLYESSNPEVKQFAPSEIWSELKQKSLDEALQYKELDRIIDKHILPKVMALVARIDVFIVGPGFGRDPLMLKTLERILQEIMVANKPVILDADSLFLISKNPGLIKGYRKAVITPNVVEFGRICSALNITNEDSLETAQKVSESLGGVVVVKKGTQEVIVRDQSCLLNDMKGSLRRVGGQGDTLTGAMATMLVWASHYQENMWQVEKTESIEDDDVALLACYAACALVRCASSKAFARYRRSMQTSNIHEFLGEAYDELFEGYGEGYNEKSA
ncbi:hypothetical protein JCM33374_g3291 [Metschnikowia sp. JCM 33374]|nr:hypothetical protein JCM33374_g3291 [Metschnikowia sp. JCM 33374]